MIISNSKPRRVFVFFIFQLRSAKSAVSAAFHREVVDDSPDESRCLGGEHNFHHLDGLEHGRLVALGPVDDLAGLGVGRGHGLAGALAVQLDELGEVEAGSLLDLDLADVHVVEGGDALAGLLDVLGHRVGDELLDDLLQVAGADLTGDDVDHLLADLPDLESEKGTVVSFTIWKRAFFPEKN